FSFFFASVVLSPKHKTASKVIPRHKRTTHRFRGAESEALGSRVNANCFFVRRLCATGGLRSRPEEGRLVRRVAAWVSAGSPAVWRQNLLSTLHRRAWPRAAVQDRTSRSPHPGSGTPQGKTGRCRSAAWPGSPTEAPRHARGAPAGPVRARALSALCAHVQEQLADR